MYIHGFMGDETSFRSFPAHVHNLLTVLLAETHVVHTKIYPRYRSKRNISFATHDFSQWLEPHETPTTDVVLLGHSMGGLLAAEVVLKKPSESQTEKPLKHRILGTINFDVPYLGMHPHVVKSGLASIFRSTEEPEDQMTPGADPPQIETGDQTVPLWTPRSNDPNYNPNYQNDVVLPVRKGWGKAWHFINKHSGNLAKATKQLVASHLEFGGAMANYSELKTRYTRIRALEEDNERVRASVSATNTAPRRVRFINYYTASNGRSTDTDSSARDKRASSDKREGKASFGTQSTENVRLQSQALEIPSAHARAPSQPPSPRVSVEEHKDDDVISKEPDIPSGGDNSKMNDMAHVDHAPVSDGEAYLNRGGLDEAGESLSISDPAQPKDEGPDGMVGTLTTRTDSLQSLPAIPDPPRAPPPLDLSGIADKDIRKHTEKEHAFLVKNYKKALKDREKAIRDREKLEQKLERKAHKISRKAGKEAQKIKEKAMADSRKQADEEWKLERRETEREMTHQQQEELRLEKERQRMEAEARRMRGEKTPEIPQPPTIAAPDPTTSTPADSLSHIPTTPSAFSIPLTPSETLASDTSNSTDEEDDDGGGGGKKQGSGKEHNFCALPPMDSAGNRDPTWVRVFMKDVDEVGAHCGLFFIDERYERLVGDVAERVEGWVRESSDERAARAWEGGGEGD